MTDDETTNLVTPTGILVYDGPPVTPDWFAARREGITGTDLPKILGISKYGNALSVWRDKRGELTDDDEIEAATWGTILEDPVAREWARRHGTSVKTVGVIANVDEPWMRASLDRVVVVCPDEESAGVNVCGLEVKTRSAYKAKDYVSDVPDDVLAQVVWGLKVTGFDHMHVAVLIGGQRMQSFRVEREPMLQGYLVDAARPVWQAVLDGYPPEVHADVDGVLLEQLNDLYRDRAGDLDLGPHRDVVMDLVDAYREASIAEREAAGEKTRVKTELVQLLGDKTTGTLDDAVVFTYKQPEPGVEVTSATLRELEATRPRFFDYLMRTGIVTQTRPGPRFNLKHRKARQ